MKTIAPSNVESTISDLALALTRLEDPNANPWVDKSFRQRLVQTEAKLRTTYKSYTDAKFALNAARAERLLHGKSMIRAIRDFAVTVNRSVRRDPAFEYWQQYFGTNSKRPADDDLNALWLEKGRAIAQAQTELEEQPEKTAATTAPPPSSPSAPEVAAAFNQANAADRAWRDAVLTFKEQARQLRQYRSDASFLLAGLRNRLKEAFRDLPAEKRREHMRTFGVRFASTPKGVPEEPDPKLPLHPDPTNQ